MDNSKRLILLQQINESSFCMDDLRLFLDTHPDNAHAISDFNGYQALRSAFLAEYTENYGPLTSYCMNDKDCKWLWTAYPWPWEGEC